MPIIVVALFGSFPSFSFVFLMIMEHFHLEEVLVKFLGGTKHLWKSVKKFFGGLPSLQLLYYHNSIYMSIAKKKIAGKSAIYFSIPFLLSMPLRLDFPYYFSTGIFVNAFLSSPQKALICFPVVIV